MFPKDEFGNTITDATGYAVSIDGDDAIPLPAPDFSYTLTIEEGFEGSISLSFTLNGEDIKNSPTTISVAPDLLPLVLEVIGGVLAFALVAFGCFYRYSRLNSAFAMQKEKEIHERARESLVGSQKQLRGEVAVLQHNLLKKRQTQAELDVMKEALDELTDARSDELKGVLINSSEVAVEGLLGKGGFGVVNLATYKGQKTAMKQLLEISEESVKRFR